MFRIIYLWKGERHSLLTQPDSIEEANRIVDEMRADRWNAWHERIR